MAFYQGLADKLEILELSGNKRRLLNICQDNETNNSLINLSGNDYLGLANSFELQEEFISTLDCRIPLYSSSSSRLLTGNNTWFLELESYLCELFRAPSALVFSSGFHMNTGIIPAISDMDTIIFSDEFNHASIIDGIRLSRKGKLIKYKHNDLVQLEQLIEQYQCDFSTVLVVTESIFSMDGDECNLKELTAIKKRYPKVILYVDEAHAIGVRGKNGLGCAEEYECIDNIDFLVGTFGKALYSVGGYLICQSIVKDYLINHMRSFIFTTALPPINIAWSHFILEKIPKLDKEREYLSYIAQLLRDGLEKKGYPQVSDSHIVPVIIGNNYKVLEKSETLVRSGFYVLPIRFPTVPKGTERLRISLNTNVTEQNIYQLLNIL
ncbi:MAG: aminotransferase class I/II-fold pyridoxal phosphate-dependent enzyme [Neisseriaceae bacterium]|nr:MAG: aminotransferase class I/II-fold pyridoxal phosphate-dependent enzyme [Neisseriaceae bacterium]